MRQEWLRLNHSDQHWACFLVFEDRVDVLAYVSATERIHRSMTFDHARALWNELLLRHWHRCDDDEIIESEITHRRLRTMMYGPDG